VEKNMETPEEIIKKSEYGNNALIEEQDKIIVALVHIWNQIIDSFENKTIAFALRVKKLLKGYPDKTISEIIDKVRNHPDLKDPAYSKDRIMQGLRLVNSRIGQNLLDWKDKPIEQKEATPFENKPYLKRDGKVFWEFYFQLNKYNFDPGIKYELIDKGKKELWSSRKLKKEIGKIMEEKREPNTLRRFQKKDLIQEIVVMLRDLQPIDLTIVRDTILQEFRDKLTNYKKWKENQLL